MAKIGTAHIEIKPVADAEALAAIVEQIADAVAQGVRRGMASAPRLSEHPCDGCGRQTSLRVCNSCHGTPDDPQWCRRCNGVCKGRAGCSPMREGR
jgi:hypothetical protein